MLQQISDSRLTRFTYLLRDIKEIEAKQEQRLLKSAEYLSGADTLGDDTRVPSDLTSSGLTYAQLLFARYESLPQSFYGNLAEAAA